MQKQLSWCEREIDTQIFYKSGSDGELSNSIIQSTSFWKDLGGGADCGRSQY